MVSGFTHEHARAHMTCIPAGVIYNPAANTYYTGENRQETMHPSGKAHPMRTPKLTNKVESDIYAVSICAVNINATLLIPSI